MTYSQNIQYGTNIPVLNTVEALRQFNNYQNNMTVIVLGNKSFADGNGGIYTFDDTSSATDDGYYTIQPTSIPSTSAGRYILTDQNTADFINDGTVILNSKSINSDSGKIITDGSGNLSVLSLKINEIEAATATDIANLTTSLNSEINRATASENSIKSTYLPLTGGTISGNLTTNGINTFNSTMNITNTSGMITANSSGTKENWYLRRSASTVTSNKYTLLNSYNGTTSNPIYFYDDGSINTTLGTVANLSASNNQFTGNVMATNLVASNQLIVGTTAQLTIDKTGAIQTHAASGFYGGLTTTTLNCTGTMIVNGNAQLDGGFTAQGTCTATTPATTDNSTNVATTAYVNNLVGSLQHVVNGDISTVGNSISLTIPNENLMVTLTSTGTTTAKISYQATTGTITPVDIRRVTVYSGSGVETFTLDGGTLTTTPTSVDDTIYTQSNDSSAHFIRVNGNIYLITVWISGSGARASLIYRELV